MLKADIKANAHLKDRFVSDPSKPSRFYGCTTAAFAKEWHDTFAVPTEGATRSITFAKVIEDGNKILHGLETNSTAPARGARLDVVLGSRRRVRLPQARRTLAVAAAIVCLNTTACARRSTLEDAYQRIYLSMFALEFPATRSAFDDCVENQVRSCLDLVELARAGKQTLLEWLDSPRRHPEHHRIELSKPGR